MKRTNARSHRRKKDKRTDDEVDQQVKNLFLPNIFPILDGFFVKILFVRITSFARLTTKQNDMKKAKYP